MEYVCNVWGVCVQIQVGNMEVDHAKHQFVFIFGILDDSIWLNY